MNDSAYDWQPALDAILEESRRSIDQQKADLAAIRSRAGGLIGYGGVIAGLSGITLKDASGLFAILVGLALLGFVAAAIFAVIVLVPYTWHFDLRGSRMLDWIKPGVTDVEDILESTIRAHDSNFAANQKRLASLHTAFLVGIVGLAVEGFFTFVAIVVKLVV